MEPQHIISIDEHHSWKDARKAGEGSSGHDRPATTREERIKILKQARAQKGVVGVAKIQKVIFLLRDHKDFSKYFEPRVASLGPIHHGNPKYQLGEKYKLRLAYEFVDQGCSGNNENKVDEKINNLCKKIKEEIKNLRECFEDEVTKKYDDDDEALVWMLFVDGCAILEYISCAANPDKFKELNIKSDSAAFAHQDLFLLENQVPYRLLKLLMNLSGKEDELKSSIASFIGNISYQQPKPIERDPTHLLDLLRTRLLDPPESLKRNPSFGASSHSQQKPIKTKLAHLLDLVRTTLLGLRFLKKSLTRLPKTRSREDNPDWQSYRNVQELKASGIRLKRSKSNYLRDISFSRRFGFYPGYLSLPPITLDDSAGPKFMNLIAYEMCLDFENDFAITSYISFLDSLIDEANDVKDMRKARVLHNFLGSDQQVAELFNEIGIDLVPSADAYKDVKLQIQEYYDNNCMTWMAQFFHDRFSAPWTMLAFLGVLLGLILTAAQTWLAAFPDPGKKSS